MVKMRIAGRDWPLKFTLNAMDTIEDRTGCTIDALNIAVKTKKDRANLLEMVAALIKAGAAEGEDTPSVEALRAALSPGELLEALRFVSDAISEGMKMQTDKAAENEAVDVVLEEIKKKESPGG